MINIIEVPNTGIGEYVSQNQERLRGSNVMYLYASSIDEARLSDHSREYTGNFNDMPSGTVIELLERPGLYTYLVKQGDGLWRDIENWSDIGSDEIPKVYNANAITIIYNPEQDMNFLNDTDSEVRGTSVNQELNNLLTQYAVAKRDPDYRYDEDDHLVLGQLASSISDMYEDMHTIDSNNAQAQNFAACWRDISEQHLSRVILNPEQRRRRERGLRDISRTLSL